MNKEQKQILKQKVAEYGLSNLRKLAPIGDLGYANGWYAPFGDGNGIEPKILKEVHKQGFKFDKEWHDGRGDHRYKCTELGLEYQVDSSG